MRLEKLHLLPLEHGRLEQIRPQRLPILVQAETLDRQPDKKGDRVKMTLSGKFLPYKRY